MRVTTLRAADDFSSTISEVGTWIGLYVVILNCNEYDKLEVSSLGD